eukprot:7835756-Pyramimonas_sp.AAC.1
MSRRLATIAGLPDNETSGRQIQENRARQITIPPIQTTDANNSFMGNASMSEITLLDFSKLKKEAIE